MDKEKYISLSQLGLYNPQRLDDKTVESLFVVRQKFFELLMDKINKEKPNSIPQHYLIIGQRGMGKSTLLKRIEVELRKEKSQFIPLLFPEEQYNLSNLSEFWLNSLDAMADALELEKKKEEVKIIDKKVREFEKISKEEDLAKEAFRFLKETAQKINKRPVLLIDNMSFIFDRLNKQEQHVLRSWLMQNDAPILIGASAVEIEDTFNYEAPFYDAFQISYLNKLSFEELVDILNNLAKLTNAHEVLANIHEEIGRLKTIHQLTGGNPRTAVMLFKIVVKGFSKEINDDLEALLDEITPLYKARFEELPIQLQIIVDAIALHWDPINLEQLRTETRLANGQLSPQLKRLVELGWIEKLNAYKAKGSAYQISERFFNIWFLMRRSSRRQKKELYCLSKFLETFYGDDLNEVAKKSLSVKSKNINQIASKLALADVVKDEKLKKQIKEVCHNELKEEAKTNPSIYEQFGITEYDIKLNQSTEENFEIENFYIEKLKIDNKSGLLWNALGYAYQFLTYKYVEAEKAYLNAIRYGYEDDLLYCSLGNLYQDNLQEYKKAEKAYLKAIEINDKDLYSKYNLVFLYRDKLNEFEKAQKYFNELVIIPDLEDSYWLNKSLFELYKRNEGISKEYLINALKKIVHQLPMNTQDDWWRFGAVVTKLGFGNWFLTILEESGFDIILAPYYVAIKALTEKDSEGYLNSKAVEIREPARKIMEIMKKY